MPDVSRRRRLLVLAICCLSLLIVGLDVTIVNVALPSIRTDLHASVSGLQWTVDAYTLVLASLLMLSGSTADRFGRRRVFQLGLTLFTAGSLLCSLAPGLGWLIAFRMVQAVGGSMLNPVAMSIITNTFTDRRERAQAIGVWGGVVGISLALGPVVGGALVGTIGWRSIFWINVPVGVAGLALTARYVAESKAPRARRFDPVGQLLIIVLLATVTYGIIEGPDHGWSSAEIVALFTVAAVALVALVSYESRRVDPLLEPRFFRSAPFSGATVIALGAFAALGGFLFVNTIYLQEARGMSALLAGLYTLPMAGAAMVCGPVSGRLVGRFGARPSLVVAGIFLASSGLLLTGLTAATSTGYLVVAYALFGVGFGFVNAPITNTAVSGMPVTQAGVAAGTASASRQIGSALGVAVIGAVATAGVHGALGPGFAAASHPAWWIITGCGFVVLVLGLLTTTDRARGTAARVAAEFDAEPPERAAVPAGVG